LRLLHAEPVWMHFCDAQYGEPADTRHIAAELRLLFASLGVRRVLYPLGLFHEDHVQAHAATRAALQGLPHIHGWAYEDVPYRGKAGVVDQRLAQLAQGGIRARRTRAMCEPHTRGLKLQALEHYASQLREIGPGAHDDAQAPERFWKLETEHADDVFR
jgi:LmbE family N-acetylglucosaminyl deacetylase